jgi:hypothetical protein
VQTYNVYDGGDWDAENDRDGYRHKVVAFGKRLGADLIGGSLYEVPPGEKTWPYGCCVARARVQRDDGAPVMNLVWAAVLAMVVFVQKVLPLPRWSSLAIAVALAAAALIVEVA